MAESLSVKSIRVAVRRAFHTGRYRRATVRDALHVLKVSARASRFHEEGLIFAERDHDNRRRFSPIQPARLASVTALRTAGLSILEIRDLLTIQDVRASDAAAINALSLSRYWRSTAVRPRENDLFGWKSPRRPLRTNALRPRQSLPICEVERDYENRQLSA
jgi:DNA-binding transcriptional MerR regulator